jgi:hypothetical protein
VREKSESVNEDTTSKESAENNMKDPKESEFESLPPPGPPLWKTGLSSNPELFGN